MKITTVDPIQCDAGWTAYTFVRVETDAGITGYGECTDWRMPNALAGGVRDMAPLLIGRDPMATGKLTSDMKHRAHQAPSGLIQRSIAGIECALWDIKGKAYGVPVYELLGGKHRDTLRLYWSHCGTYRTRYFGMLNKPPLRSYADIAALGREVVDRGYTALKTNIVVPGDPATTVRTLDGNMQPGVLDRIVRNIDAFREGVGDAADIALDINFHFKTQPARQIARALESKGLMWLEFDSFKPSAVREVKDASSTPICSGESVNTLRDYLPFLQSHAMDIAMVDVPWAGVIEAVAVGAVADTHEILVAPHNYYSHLSTFMTAHFCAALKNFKIMETDVDSVPWRDELVTETPPISDGHLIVPDAPGWGADLAMDAVERHQWKGNIPAY